MEKYDVVIVGAGPAGLNCARHLVGSGKRVLIIEKNDIIGPKVCAGGVTRHDVEYLKLPKRLLDSSHREAVIHTPHFKDVLKEKKEFVYTVDRRVIGQWMLSLIKRKGIKIRTGSNVTEITKGHITIDDCEKIGYKYLVGADGSLSIVRRFLGLGCSNTLAVFQYLVPTRKYKKMEFFFDTNLFGFGYGWIFPHKNYVSVGCGTDPREMQVSTLKENFAKWMAQKRIDLSKARYEGFPINLTYSGWNFGNVFLTGDAAGLASNVTGEGIYQALISGEEVAKTILNKEYVSIPMKKLVGIKSVQSRIYEVSRRTGPLMETEYDLAGLLLKSRLIDRAILERVIE